MTGHLGSLGFMETTDRIKNDTLFVDTVYFVDS